MTLLWAEEVVITMIIATTAGCSLAYGGVFPGVDYRLIIVGAIPVAFGFQIIYDFIIFPRMLSPLRRLPKAKGYLNTLKMLFETPRGKSALHWLRTIPNDGLINFAYLPKQTYLLATNHQALLDIMSTRTYDFEKPWRFRDFLARIIGFGLILSEGDPHKTQRKAVNPSFNIKNIRALYNLMWEKTGIFLKQLEKEIKDNPVRTLHGQGTMGRVEMTVWASRLTLDIIGPTAMGRDFQSLTSEENKVADVFLNILEPTWEKLLFLSVNFVLPQWLAVRIPWHLNKVVSEDIGYLRSLCHEIVQEKRLAFRGKKLEEKQLETDILGTLMLRGEFSDNDLVDQMLTFLAAGHETTAGALTMACWMLSLHQGIQTRLREEIRAHIPSGDGPITWDELESLPILNGVCQEILRLWPTVPATIREAVRETEVAGMKISRGTRIVLCPYAINRSPHFWGETADQFIPERWIDVDENGKQSVNHHGGASTNFAQITFLHGQRSCIGKDFSRAELRCAVAGVVGRFAMEMQDPTSGITLSGAVTVKPKEGLHLKMIQVDGW
ncbi:putative cytochrome P450 monooxygenase [Talaromyces proteolyticus]|uniref:Cytochrome P450 monooxygenase n=1 Tax=Talaromyces proteolyticus TaxID=1131652 RepID=A0AAD4PTN2_9EURO|nr:putative cytochrome P450 monooxygenase [Talaromyces proteolyticus]KAH8688999.1 putative cytochrome P450 monooxygenase [Talaromyces proteolyticus]